MANSLHAGQTPNVRGAGGSAAPRERLTITKTTTSESEVRAASLAGSFNAPVLASSGDIVIIVGTNGTNELFTVL